jgi:Zn-dependent protease
MKNHYKEFTPSMKALLWGTVVLTLINIVCFVLTLIPNNPFGGRILIGSVICGFLTVILIVPLAVKIQTMNMKKKQ